VEAGERASGVKTVAETPIVALRNVSKTFGRARVLDCVDLEVYAGEVHGLLGQNGSGKSTLIKILTGFHEPDAGAELEVRGSQVRLPLRSGRFHALGLSFVHQDLALIPSLSVTENLVAGQLARSEPPMLRWRRERRRARETFARYGVQLDPGAMVSELTGTDRALLAIVRAMEELRGAGGDGERGTLLVLDEPTAFLPRAGVELLFGLVRGIARRGAGVLFVTHDLEEVLQLTDRATVLFNGRVAGTVKTSETDDEQLVEMIVGRRLELLQPQPGTHTGAAVAVRVEGLLGKTLRETSFEIHEGEILGVTGLLGAGFEEIPYLMFGARPDAAGRIQTGSRGQDLASMTPARAMAAGMALIPADRAADGSVGTLSVGDNVTMTTLGSHQRLVKLDRRGLMRSARALGERFDVRPNDPRMAYTSLSGGNQQKVLLAKWFETKPSLLLLHEPTQGVDVGARHQVYAMVRDATKGGTAVLCASSDYEQLALLCDRVLVFARGRLFRELSGDQLTKERVTAECLASFSVQTTSPTEARTSADGTNG
jgi:ribose transport system ATP-binding protein